WWIGLPVVVLWLGAGLWLAQAARHETSEMFDRELQRTAASVLAVIASAPDAALVQRESRVAIDGEDDEGARPEIVVRDRRGDVLLDASTLPPLHVDQEDAHFHTLRYAGETWRVHQRWDAAQRHWIQVAAPLHDRDQLMEALVQALVVPLLALLLLLPVATWLGLRAGLAPLRAVSRAIDAQPARRPSRWTRTRSPSSPGARGVRFSRMASASWSICSACIRGRGPSCGANTVPSLARPWFPS